MHRLDASRKVGCCRRRRYQMDKIVYKHSAIKRSDDYMYSDLNIYDAMVSMPQQQMWCYFYGGNSPCHIACVVLNLCGIIDSISRNISWPIGYRIFRGRCGFYRQYRLANSHDISQPIGLYIFRVRCVDCIVNIDSQTLVIYIYCALVVNFTPTISSWTLYCALVVNIVPTISS